MLENPNYPSMSKSVVEKITSIVKNAKCQKIFIHTNLKHGLPIENIHKIASPFVEAWAGEQFEDVSISANNEYELADMKSCSRLSLFDFILKFQSEQTVGIDVKATSLDIENAGLRPNITSFGRIRSEYENNPDLVFIILSLKHKMYLEVENERGVVRNGIEISQCTAYDLKYVSDTDLGYNPALGTGQLQIKDIHNVKTIERTTNQFIQLLDEKFIRSRGKEKWEKLCSKHNWKKTE